MAARTRLLKRVDRARLTGRHSHTQTNALPQCSPRPGVNTCEAPSANSADESAVGLQAAEALPPFVPEGAATAHFGWTVPALLPRALEEAFLVSTARVRGFEPVTLSRDAHVRATSPSGRTQLVRDVRVS